MNVCFSGGAKGADSIFSYNAIKKKHKVINFVFDWMNSRCDKNTLFELSDDELKQANETLKKCSQRIKRYFPTKNEYVNKLLQRNYYQILESDTMYAVTYLDGNKVDGGTAWAVEMFKMLKHGDIFIFDMHTNDWYLYDHDEFVYTEPYTPNGFYTGVGSRNITEQGKNAIRNLYFG